MDFIDFLGWMFEGGGHELYQDTIWYGPELWWQ